MADPHIKTDEPPSQLTLLLDSNHNNRHQAAEGEYKDTQLDQTLQRLETFLTLLGFDQSSWLSLALSWTALVFLGVVLPVVVLEMFNCSDCEKYQIKGFELVIVGSQAVLAAVSLLCISHCLRKYGIRRFLFVDRYSGRMVRFRNDYIRQIKVSTIVQVVGIILSLHAATKISGRAQGIATVASRWHALMTCSSNDSPHNRSSDSLVNFEAANRLSSLHTSYSESDLESTDFVHVPTNSQLASHMASYHKRQAFVLYLQTNHGGITIFGWMVDRGLLTTIFFIELSLITFLLGQTIVFSAA